MYARVILVGRLGRDPEIRVSVAGRAFVKNVLAVDRLISRGGGMDREVSWIPVSFWNGLVKRFEGEKAYGKGDLVLVEGDLRTFEFEDENGDFRTGWEVVARRALLLRRAGAGEAEAGSESGDVPREEPGSEPADDEIPF